MTGRGLRRAALALLLVFSAAGAAAQSLPKSAKPTSPADVLRDDFDGPDFAAGGGLYYKQNAEQAAGTYVFDKAAGRTGGGLRLSVRSLCPVEDKDCSERAEIWERTNLRVPYEQGVWYGFAVRLDEPVPTDDHRYLIAQWKREINPGADGDYSPFLALRLRQGRLFATVESNFAADAPRLVADRHGGCPVGTTPVWQRPETDQMRALVATEAGGAPELDEYDECTDKITVTRHSDMPDPKSGWIDFAVYSRPGPSGNGRIELYANGQPIVTVEGRIGHAGSGLGRNQYFKFGPYRAGHPGVWALTYDDFRRSLRCEDVLVGAACPF
jgi:hypothetical protein